MSATQAKILLGFALACPVASVSANVITEWDAKAVAVIAKATPAPLSQREAALVDIAMFEVVNAIERRYRPYLIDLTAAPTISQEAAAATAAATALTALHSEAAGEIKTMLADYLATIPDGEAKAEGEKLGVAVANKILQARANDGATAPAEDQARCLRADTNHGSLGVAEPETVRSDSTVAIPTRPTACARKQGMGR
jgi:hypothetical protein